jgi:hypothetical protein
VKEKTVLVAPVGTAGLRGSSDGRIAPNTNAGHAEEVNKLCKKTKKKKDGETFNIESKHLRLIN